MKRPSKRDRPTKRVCKCGVKLPHSYGRNGDKVTGLCRKCLAPINASTVSIKAGDKLIITVPDDNTFVVKKGE